MTDKKLQHGWVLIAGIVFTLALVGGTVALDVLNAPVDAVIRAGALLGYIAVFLTCLSSRYMRELTRYFGRPFLKLHHTVAITGLAALLLHALGVAWRAGNIAVFLPDFSSVRMFFALGGRPAFWLFALTALTAFLRKTIGPRWKLIHWANYLAFLLGTIHAQLIGPNFGHWSVRLVSGAMMLALIVVFVQRRQKRDRK